jgi:ribosomal protein S18 acetylase RimI-like enzyme
MHRADIKEVVGLFASRPQYFTAVALQTIELCLHRSNGFDAKYNVMVAVEAEGGKIAGCAVWSYSLYEVELNWLAVSSNHERRGVGRSLIDEAVSCSKRVADRIRYLRLVTADIGQGDDSEDRQYRGTHEFYKRCGFSQVATLPGYWPSGEAAALFMRRIIG